MKTPTREDFDHFISLTQDLRARVAKRLGENWQRKRTFATDDDEVRRVFVAIHEAMQELGQEIQASPVGKWFDQKEAQTGLLRLQGVRKARQNQPVPMAEVIEHADRLFAAWTRPRTKEDYAGLTMRDVTPGGEEVRRPYTDEELEEVVDRANEVWSVEKRIESRLKALSSDHPYLIFWRALANAFLGYFYTESYRRYSVKASDRQEAARKLLQAFTAIQDPRLWDASGLTRPTGIVRTRHDLTISALRESAGSDAKPLIKKVDDTAPERALIYELWSIFHPSNGRKYVHVNAAIFHFTNMPGIRNPPASADAVADMLKGWEAEGFRPLKLDRIR